MRHQMPHINCHFVVYQRDTLTEVFGTNSPRYVWHSWEITQEASKKTWRCFHGKINSGWGIKHFPTLQLMNEEGSRWRRNGSLLRCLWQEKVPQYQDTLRNLGYRLWVNIVFTENRMLKLPWSLLTAYLCSWFLVHHHFCDQNSKICPLTCGQVTIFGQHIIILLWKIIIFSIRINTAISWLSPDFQRRPLHILVDYRSQNISIGIEKTKESTGRARPSRKSPINSHHNWPRLSACWSGDPTGSGDSISMPDGCREVACLGFTPSHRGFASEADPGSPGSSHQSWALRPEGISILSPYMVA